MPRPLTPQRQILRYVADTQNKLPVLSFRDVVGGNLRFADVQGKVVLIGLTASGVASNTFPDSRLDPVPGIIFQARAVSSLLSPPFRHVSPWLTGLACAALAALAVWLGGLWGFGLAFLALGLSTALYFANWLFPGTTASLSAIIGTVFVAVERFWSVRRLGTLDPLTGLGNRLAFTRAVENRWSSRAARPVGLLLLDVSGFRRVNEVYGRQAGDEALRGVSAQVRAGRTRRELVFRWGADEFALLVEPVGEGDVARSAEQLSQTLSAMSYKDMPLKFSIGQAVSTAQMTQPSDLVEQASRDRYRMKYRLEQQSSEL